MSHSILLLCYEYPPLGGGGAQVVSGLAARLGGSGVHVDVVTMWYRGLPFKEVIGNVTIYRVPCIRLRRNVCSPVEMIPYVLLGTVWTLYLTLTKRHDVRHVHFIFPDGVIAMVVKWLTQARFVITAHGSDVPGYNPNRFKRLHRLLAPLWRRVVASAERIIAPSRALKALLRAKGAGPSIVVIPNGVDVDRFDPLRPKQPIVLCVARLFERKGVQYLVECARTLPAPWRIVIAGDGPHMGEIRRLAAEHGDRVELTGLLDNSSTRLRELYESAAIFAFPSAVENFPMCLLEAMTAGCAIVTTSGTGCAEVVGDAALLVEARQPNALRAALERLIGDRELQVALGRRARARVVRYFSWPVVLDDHAQVYASLVDEFAGLRSPRGADAKSSVAP